MVKALDIATATKHKLKKMVKKFKKLFEGGLGKVDIQPVDLKVEEGTKQYATTYYNIPKMYEKPVYTKVNQMVDVNILKRLQFHKDSPWTSPSFILSNEKRWEIFTLKLRFHFFYFFFFIIIFFFFIAYLYFMIII